MSTPSLLQDGNPLPHTDSMVSSSSQPETSSNPDGYRASPAIMCGTERLLVVYEEEMARVEAQHKKQMDDVAARFDEFRYFATQEQLKLEDRIYLLEAELAARGVDMPPLAKGHVPGQTTGTTSDMEDILDVETIHLVRDLARLIKSAEMTTTRTPRGLENNTLDVNHIPEFFLPALAQYLASHRTALRDLQEKLRAVERERDALREIIPITPPRPIHKKSNLVAPASFFVPSSLRHEAREANSNSPLGAGTWIS